MGFCLGLRTTSRFCFLSLIVFTCVFAEDANKVSEAAADRLKQSFNSLDVVSDKKATLVSAENEAGDIQFALDSSTRLPPSNVTDQMAKEIIQSNKMTNGTKGLEKGLEAVGLENINIKQHGLFDGNSAIPVYKMNVSNLHPKSSLNISTDTKKLPKTENAEKLDMSSNVTSNFNDAGSEKNTTVEIGHNVTNGSSINNATIGPSHNMTEGPVAINATSVPSNNVTEGFGVNNATTGPSNNVTEGSGASNGTSGSSHNVTEGLGANNATSGPSHNVTEGSGASNATTGTNNNVTEGSGTSNAITGPSNNVTEGSGANNVTIGSSHNVTKGSGASNATTGLSNNVTEGSGASNATIGPSNNVTEGSGANNVTIGLSHNVTEGSGANNATTGPSNNVTEGSSANNATTGPSNNVTERSGINNVTSGPSHNVTIGPGVNATETNHTKPSTNDTEPIKVVFSGGQDLMEDKYGKIIYVSVFFRHGIFNLPDPFPSDPYDNVTIWPEGFAELTNEGKKYSFAFGQWLQARYKKLLGEQYKPTLTAIESGGIDVTLMSAESVAAGLFPPSGKQVWNDKLKWQPVAIFTLPPESDNVILMQKSCKMYSTELKNFNESPEATSIYEQYDATFFTLNQHFIDNFTTTDILTDLRKAWLYYEDLVVEEQKGLPLPNWTKDIYPEPLSTLAKMYFDKAACTEEMQKFKAGPFLKLLQENIGLKMQNNTNGTSSFEEVLHLYSGGADGMAFIMKALDIYNFSIPSFSSALIFELRQNGSDYVVTVSYKNGAGDDLYMLTIRDCETACPYDKFTIVTKNIIPDNWDDDCNTFSITDLTFSIPLIIAGIVVVIILLILIVLLFIKCCKSKKKEPAEI